MCCMLHSISVISVVVLGATTCAATPAMLSQQKPPLAVRGGGSEWVCDGDVCELKPASKSKKKVSSLGTKSKAKKKVSSSSRKSVAASDSDFAHEPQWLQSLRAFFGGSRTSPLQKGLSFIARLLGVGAKPAFADECDVDEADHSQKKNTVSEKKSTLSRSQQRAASKNKRGGIARAKAGRRGAGSTSSSALRIQRELRDFQTNPPPHCAVAVRPDNLNVWIITLTGVEGTLYAGEKYKLRVEFSKEYPSKPPSVYFLKPTPRHQHVYTNGDICLDLLGKGWKPQLTVRTLAVSILSILSSAREKGIPPDNANHADNAPGKVQEGWLYHDDHC